MNQSVEKLTQIEKYVHSLFHDDASGHDYYHMKRVAIAAKRLAEREGADTFIAEAAGWMHDIGDKKLFEDPQAAQDQLDNFLIGLELTNEQISAIKKAMKDVSFSKGNIPRTLEGKIVQDADRLDAIGAIGIARTFAYGGVKGRPFFTENKEDISITSIQHFHDKLLRLKELMNTESARAIAVQKHQFMETFLDQFHKEWDVHL
ncbi:HD domain-containing protein [Aquibacillus kalidii]|uniref:HD domain-containing protein n=1 Tax=Aquibacillus kalidii TaxID=2762597 RepID=UPI0016496EEC|nr:HD domain-containing protein [Aquibacillus kalidii]